MRDGSKVVRARNFRWEGVERSGYQATGARFPAGTRQVLLGEGHGEEALSFVTRYFEIEPGGCSSLERHQHPHAVVVLCGAGQVLLGEEVYDLLPLDCVYVAPGCLHQFHATSGEPLGFLCIVDRIRDAGVPPDDEERHRLSSRPEVAALLDR